MQNEGKGTAREWLEVICVYWLIGIKLFWEREERERSLKDFNPTRWSTCWSLSELKLYITIWFPIIFVLYISVKKNCVNCQKLP